ncbi:MAG: hypothetical protein WCE93_09255 [Nitrososphaeraceae archaeon]
MNGTRMKKDGSGNNRKEERYLIWFTRPRNYLRRTMIDSLRICPKCGSKVKVDLLSSIFLSYVLALCS